MVFFGIFVKIVKMAIFVVRTKIGIFSKMVFFTKVWNLVFFKKMVKMWFFLKFSKNSNYPCFPVFLFFLKQDTLFFKHFWARAKNQHFLGSLTGHLVVISSVQYLCTGIQLPDEVFPDVQIPDEVFPDVRFPEVRFPDVRFPDEVLKYMFG